VLSLEYKLRTTNAQQTAIEEAIRTVQFIRNKAVRLWMDGRGVGQDDLQALCAQLAKDSPLVTRLNSLARQASADRAWQAISRFYKNCRAHTPGKKGDPQFQTDNRAVEYKTSGWKLDRGGKRLTFTDGMGIGTLRLIGTRSMAAFPTSQIKRVRLVQRADGYDVQFGGQADRHITHEPTGAQVGMDLGLKVSSMDSKAQSVSTPRFLRTAEQKLKRLHRHKDRPLKGSTNRKKAIKRLAKGYLRVSRQRKDFAAKTARALVSSNDLIAYENWQIANLIKNPRLAKRIRDAAWGQFLGWVRYYGTLANVPVIAVPSHFTTHECRGVLPDGTRCQARIWKSLSGRTHVCARGGVVLDRDQTAAQNILDAALALRTAGQAGTGTRRGANASGQTPAGGRKRLRSVKVAG
jgi:putative transposase